MPQATNPNNRSSFWWFLDVITLVLRILLWPLRRVSILLFPAKELDGLSPAVTAKAAQNFVELLRTCCNPSHTGLLDVFSTTGFNSVKSQATGNSSLIFLYLHSPLHAQGEAALRRVLLNDGMLQFFNESTNSVLPLGVSIHSGQGAQLANVLGAASFPLVALLQPQRGSFQLLLRAEGPLLLQMPSGILVTQMQAALTRHQTLMAQAEAERLQRQEEAQLRREQDLEFEATLRADQERQRQIEEAERLERERLALEEEESRRAVEAKQNQMDAARALLRDEPAGGGTRVRFVLPTGAKIDRRFHSDDTVATLRAFLMLHFEENSTGITNIGLSTSYPKKSYGKEENSQTLDEAGLSPQAVLMVQDLDA